MTPPRTDGADKTVEELITAGIFKDWRDPSGTVTVDNLRRSLAALVADGRPLLLASIELEEELGAVVAEYAGAVDLYLSPNMPGDRRVYVVSAAARPFAGL